MKKIIRQTIFSIVFVNLFAYADMPCFYIGTVKEFNGHYYAQSAKTMTFEEAYTLTKGSNAYLAVPNTKEENAFLSSMIDIGSNAFIGVADLSYTNNYCFEDTQCSYDDARFKDINNQPLIFKNWEDKQPDNKAKISDNGIDKDKGEHFVILSSLSKKWSDVDSTAKYKALFEFETMPSCFNADSFNSSSNTQNNNTSAGGSDDEELGTPQGSQDANNDGWNDDGSCGGQIYIFNGKDNRCKSWDRFAGLTGGGCCDKDKVFLGLVSCSEGEKKLAQDNRDRKCVEVGEYCSKRNKLIGCIQRRKSFCCFNSKLARIFHEQGRPQIGMGWGSSEAPQCRGFTPEEFQKLDFSEIDLSEFVADLMGKINADDIAGKFSADSLKIKDKIQNNLNNTSK